ncbi:aminodeoxychorismate synthase component I [Alkalibaculum sp. M08DMB]|uniref:aminodeoxychorismate synthase n=1 Tax=Alkalibaculum sporogenes TaxID=2655001 RepID=A0A6A7K6S7_9FIRM|nr:aminodeoxychorismate synthase component I [Alkalibaculum sporogenes]MPW25085.1 aminodeoxychorismate synthase component I [Alkalibaculum sporogenes]
MLIKEINTQLDSLELYTIFKEREYSFFLDSGRDHDTLGKYSFIGFDPFLVFRCKGNTIEIKKESDVKVYTGDPFDILKELMNKYHRDYTSHLPFVGGAVGFFSYDLCHHIEDLPRQAIDDIGVPDCHLGFYDGVIIIDHRKNKTYIASLGIKGEETSIIGDIEDIIINATLPTEKKEFYTDESITFNSNFTQDEYMQALDTIHQYIKSGDIYQVNLTQRFDCDLNVTPFDLYCQLREINPAPFASFIDFGAEGQVVSSSPERFISINNKKIEARPIKGTIPRGKDPEEDQKNRLELMNSEKDKSELLMIVDLERNDVGKISKTGTVKVPELFKLEEYQTVFHLVATVTGELQNDLDSIDCIKATFPGGSITGTPKIRAMEVIDELEPTQRNIYTGSIGYVGFNGDLDLNIVIRTILCKDSKAYFQAGGGIVWDSQNQLEYEESFHKARALMDALKRRYV